MSISHTTRAGHVHRTGIALGVAAATVATILSIPSLPEAHAGATVTFHEKDRYCEITLTDPHYSLFKIQNYGSMWRSEVARAAIMSWLPKEKLTALKKARAKALHASDADAAEAIDNYQDLHQELADEFSELKHTKGLTPQESDILWFSDPFGPTAGDDWIEPVPPKPGFKYSLSDLRQMFDESSRTGKMFVFATPSTRPGRVPEGPLRDKIHTSFDYQVSDIAEGVRVYTDGEHSAAWNSLVSKVDVPDPYTAQDARVLADMTWEKWAPVFDDYQRCRQNLYVLAHDGKITSPEVISRLVGHPVVVSSRGVVEKTSSVPTSPAAAPAHAPEPVVTTSPVVPSAGLPASSSPSRGQEPVPSTTDAPGTSATPPPPGAAAGGGVTNSDTSSYSDGELIAIVTAIYAVLTAVAVRFILPRMLPTTTPR